MFVVGRLGTILHIHLSCAQSMLVLQKNCETHFYSLCVSNKHICTYIVLSPTVLVLSDVKQKQEKTIKLIN